MPVNTSNINYCYVCGKLQTKIARHLITTHKTHIEIHHILSLSKKSKERRRLLEKLRNQGNFKHDNAVLQTGTGLLKVKRKTKTYAPAGKCIHCIFGGMHEDAMKGQMMMNLVKKVLDLAAAVEWTISENLKWSMEVNWQNEDDDVASVVQNDVCILQFAQSLFNRHGQNPTKYEYMRKKLREVGRLSLCLREDFSVHNIEEAIKPGNFNKVVHLALKLGHTLKKISDNIQSRALVAENENYAQLAQVTLAQIVVFNRRRAGEVSKMHLKHFLQRAKTKLHEDVAMGLSKVEQKLCKYFCRVAVLLTPSMVYALLLLTNKRSQCSVSDKNIFLFDCLRIHANQCGAKQPEYLKSTQLRKHVATLSQILNLKNNELDQIADFMGDDIRVHRDFYRLPVPTTQLAKISKLHLSMEKRSKENLWMKLKLKVCEILLSDVENGVSESESDEESTVHTLSECGSSQPVDAPSDTTVTDHNNEARGLEITSTSATQSAFHRLHGEIWTENLTEKCRMTVGFLLTQSTKHCWFK
ncbi:hypothetical protein Q5P01_016543 [Channa striata]|uniref:Uncharacterized protein n=1 Tax=Channa striata TaxID=64152 RepID=A0AA88SAK1_CHASR|nr:hypothetical protein Q5P01_016543 [Channa striata]